MGALRGMPGAESHSLPVFNQPSMQAGVAYKADGDGVAMPAAILSFVCG